MLAVERFDLDAEGNYLAFEDFCTLAGLHSFDKYNGTYEQIARIISAESSDPQADLEMFYRHVVFSILIRNGDAHRKNFGFLYDNANNVRLAPCYDVLCSAPYGDDSLALLFGGSKRYPKHKHLVNFGIQHCRLYPKQNVEDIIAATAEAIHQTLQDHDAWERAIGKDSPEVSGLIRSGWANAISLLAPTSIPLAAPQPKRPESAKARTR